MFWTIFLPVVTGVYIGYMLSKVTIALLTAWYNTYLQRKAQRVNEYLLRKQTKA